MEKSEFEKSIRCGDDVINRCNEIGRQAGNKINGQSNIKDVKDINYSKVFMHFTYTEKLDFIFEEGLKADVGDNSAAGGDKKAFVFFTKGIDNALRVQAQCLYLASKSKEYIDEALKNNENIESKKYKVFKETSDGIDEILKEKNVDISIMTEKEAEVVYKEATYEYMMRDMQNKSCLVLDLEEGKDFSMDATGPNPKKGINRNRPWDMVTYEGLTVAPEKIQQLGSEGKPKNCLDIVKYMYKKFIEIEEDERGKNPNANNPFGEPLRKGKEGNFTVLEEFMSYVERREKSIKQQTEIQGNKKETNDSGER